MHDNETSVMDKLDIKPGNDTERIPTKQRILDNAVNLFAVKGYTETTIRELATASGMKEASIYNHFQSKSAILEHILEEFSRISLDSFIKDKLVMLKENPTAGGILDCMKLIFSEGKEDYYLKELYVIFQEQHRNPMVRKFVSEGIILSTEHVIRTIIITLKDIGILRRDTDSDFWVKMHSSLVYTFASRSLLGIGDSSPGFSGMGLMDMLWNMYNLMLKTCGSGNGQN